MRMLLLLLVLTAAAPLSAQLSVVCGSLPAEYGRAIFDKRTAKYIQPWSCVISNPGAVSSTVSEAELMGFLLENGVTALSAEAIRVGAPEMKRRGKKATAMRVLQRVGTLTAVLAAGEIISIGPAWGAAAGFAALQLPQWGEALAGRDPDDTNFERVAMAAEDLAVGPGRSVSLLMFAAPEKQPRTVKGAVGYAPQQVIDSISGFQQFNRTDVLWAAQCK